MATDREKQVTVSFDFGVQADVDAGMSLLELSRDYSGFYKYPVIAARVNNTIKELGYQLKEDCKVGFVDLTDEDGSRIYRRSLHFILVKAVNDLYPDRKVAINHSISKGLYCEVTGEPELSGDEVAAIEQRMRELVRQCIPFKKKVIPIEEAREFFEKKGRMDRFHAIEYRNNPYVSIYECDGYEDYFYGYMAPDTGFASLFSLIFYPPGFIILYPEKSNPGILPEFAEQKKLFNIFSEYKRWGRILGVGNVGALNDIVKLGKSSDLIRISEALQEKKIAQIADMIACSGEPKRVVLISGPSSSGKTTFAERLSIQLRVNGLKPVTINLDNYFVDRDSTPRDENGELDFEALEAIDVKLFNLQLAQLINGMEVEIPIFNFPNGTREPVGKKMRLEDDNILVIEGIHGLNEKLTRDIPKKNKFKIYVSALTSMNIDDHNRIPTTDTRIIRRIVRDYQFRGTNASNTIKRWPSVRRGEERNIFPFQESADVMFNSSLMVELGVLKSFAEPLLSEIGTETPEYSEAKRLLGFLSYFLPIDNREIPFNSIIREFIGGSCFY